MFFPRHLFYLIQDQPRGVPVDYVQPANGYEVAIVPDDGGESDPFLHPSKILVSVDEIVANPTANIPLSPADGQAYRFAVRARTAAGLFSGSAIGCGLVAQGGELLVRPNRPTRVVATPLAGGLVKLSWSHDGTGGAAEASAFKVFGNGGGDNPISFATPLAQVGGLIRKATVSGLPLNQRVDLLVRAYAESGAHDGGVVGVTVVPRDATPAALPGSVTASYASE